MGRSQSGLSILLRPVSAVLVSAALVSSGMLSATNCPAAKAIGVSANAGDVANCGEIGFLVAVSGTSQKQLGRCALKHTDVRADVSGFVSRVTVKQQFHNPYKEKIEAIYTFPLPENAAVDEMTMKIGNRVIKGSIKEREQAKEIYKAAKNRGNVASLLDQERPNIFTQALANIEPGQNIDIEIKYVDVLKYDKGAFTFSFPTVVGARFIPGEGRGHKGWGVADDTDMVPDASLISPPVLPDAERAGHDISISLNINSPVTIEDISSKLHQVDIARVGPQQARVTLKPADRIPNRDFVLTWNVASEQMRSGCLTHSDNKGGYFSLVLIPPKRVPAESVAPKEMVFLIDCSGSQSGRPIQKAKETINYILDHMNPHDTFQIISFNNNATFFANEPQLCSPAMKERAHRFLESLEAHGGTWMASAVEEACNLPNPENRLRIVTFMTDGYVGNDFEVISLIKKHRGHSRWFSFGTGNSVNRFLIDKVAAEGGGEAEYVLFNKSAEEVGKKFYDRISSPVLTDINVQFSGVEVKEVFPKDQADLWAQKPLCITGRYLKPGHGKAILTGYSAGKPYKQEIPISFAKEQPENAVLKSIWARAKVDRLMSEDWMGMQTGQPKKELRDEIVETALQYHIMTQFTSFVAVEDDRVTHGRLAKTVPIPVETPQGLQNQVGIQPLRHPSSTSYLHSSNGAPAPIRASSGSGSYASFGLPSTSMGKFVHQPGDNQYSFSQRNGTVYLSPSSAPPPPVVSLESGSASMVYGDEGITEMPSFRAQAGSVEPESEKSGNLARRNEKAPSGLSGKSSIANSRVISKRLLDLYLSVQKASLGSGDKAEQAKARFAAPVKVNIVLKSQDAKIMHSLKSLGFVLEKVDGKVVRGTISLSKLILLASLSKVQSVDSSVQK